MRLSTWFPAPGPAKPIFGIRRRISGEFLTADHPFFFSIFTLESAVHVLSALRSRRAPRGSLAGSQFRVEPGVCPRVKPGVSENPRPMESLLAPEKPSDWPRANTARCLRRLFREVAVAARAALFLFLLLLVYSDPLFSDPASHLPSERPNAFTRTQSTGPPISGIARKLCKAYYAKLCQSIF